MNKQEIINKLIQERSNAALIFKTETVEALNEAIEVLEEIDNLKREDIYHMKRAHEAEMLLREVQPYALQIDRDKISEFFKRDTIKIDLQDENIFHEYSEAGRKI